SCLCSFAPQRAKSLAVERLGGINRGETFEEELHLLAPVLVRQPTPECIADGLGDGVRIVLDQRVGQADRVALLAADEAPDQSAIRGVELFEACFLLD